MSGNGRMDSVMLEEFNIGQMGQSTKDTGGTVRNFDNILEKFRFISSLKGENSLFLLCFSTKNKQIWLKEKDG